MSVQNYQYDSIGKKTSLFKTILQNLFSSRDILFDHVISNKNWYSTIFTNILPLVPFLRSRGL